MDPDFLGGRVLVYFYDDRLNILVSVEYDLCTEYKTHIYFKGQGHFKIFRHGKSMF